jgi:hypothetical protein
LDLRGLVGLALVIVVCLEFGWWKVVNGTMETPLIPPVNPCGGSELHLLEGTPGTGLADDLGFVQAVHRLGQGVIV